MSQSPETNGGAGFTFESAVSAIYLAALLCETTIDGLKGRMVKCVKLQQVNNGEPLDDLIIDCESPNGEEARLSLQIKSSITISKSNTEFNKIIKDAYDTIKKDTFRHGRDRVGFVIKSSSSSKLIEAFIKVCEWARNDISSDDFINRFGAGKANDEHRKIRDCIKEILTEEQIDHSDINKKMHDLFCHFIVLKFDFMHEGSKDEAHSISLLQHRLLQEDKHRSQDLWKYLQYIARESTGYAGSFNLSILLEKLSGSFTLACSLFLKKNLQILAEESLLALEDISDTIGGTAIFRSEVITQIKEKLNSTHFMQLIGLPGSGKSAVLREIASQHIQSDFIFLKSDRLTNVSANWSSYAASLGCDPCSLEALLTEITVTTNFPIIFIDGLDRIEAKNRGLVKDLLNTIKKSVFLKEKWKIIATLRSNGIDEIKNWLPGIFFSGEISTVEIQSFNDREAELLANHNPELRPFLFNNSRIKEISRRPFFAAIIEKTLKLQQCHPSTLDAEIKLIDIWWRNLGNQDDPDSKIRCQRTLIRLAKDGAKTFGRHIKHPDNHLNAISDLKRNGIIQDEQEEGHVLKFSHDIFFEWSFVHLLIERQEEWISEIKAIGEPPSLGRSVELLSQNKFLHNKDWVGHLSRLEQIKRSFLRSQWLRMWLFGPVGLSGFDDTNSIYSSALLENNGERLIKFAVWFQAEKTRPNASILDGFLSTAQSSSFEKMQLADEFSWPSDRSLWRKCCEWLLNLIEAARAPYSAISDILSIFEVWQNAFCNTKDSTSERILINIQRWLEELEDRRLHYKRNNDEEDLWKTCNGLSDLEDRLRKQLLRSAQEARDGVSAYLDRVLKNDDLRHETYKQILQFSPLLAKNHAKELVDLTLSELLKPLPEDVKSHIESKNQFYMGPSSTDWYDLSISHSDHLFNPSSPTREPFFSLFQYAPQEALRLVRDLSNHTITSWQQLNELDHHLGYTPLPFMLSFPWGEQTFWGNQNIYIWFRGLGSQNAVQTAFMALEEWALSEAEKQRDIDEIIRDVLIDHKSCAVLGIAASVAIAYQHVSSTTLPIVTCQHLWSWDIYRISQESLGGNLSGFDRAGEEQYLDAVRYGNNRKTQGLNIQDLAMYFMANKDAALSEQAAILIKNFPTALPFQTKEEQEDANIQQMLLEKANRFVEYSNKNNYSYALTEDPTKCAVEVKLPELSPQNHVKKQQLHHINKIAGISRWANNFLVFNELSNKYTVPEVFSWAKVHENDDLFTQPQSEDSTSNNYYLPSAIAGVAAVILTLPDRDQDEIIWAESILDRAVAIPDAMQDPKLTLIYHPRLFAVYGLAAMIEKNIDTKNAKINLLKLTGDYFDHISSTALSSMSKLWDTDKQLSWFAFNIGLMFSKNIFRKSLKMRQEFINTNIRFLSEKADFLPGLMPFPDPWVLDEKNKDRLSTAEAVVLKRPLDFLDCNYLLLFLNKIPSKQVMSDPSYRELFVELCDKLFKWTIERLSPSLTQGNQRDYADSESYLWKLSLSNFLAAAALHMNAGEVLTLFLQPIFSLSDDVAVSLLEPFVTSFMHLAIIEAPSIENSSLEIIQACVSRILKHSSFNNARRRNGKFSDDSLVKFIRSIFFTHLTHTERSLRFTNGNWQDIKLIQPILDLIIKDFGDLPYITNSFLNLCERALDNYPSDQFVEQIKIILAKQKGTPLGWHGTRIAGKIAILIQAIGERDSPLIASMAQAMLGILDTLVDMGDRRAAALQTSNIFKEIRS